MNTQVTSFSMQGDGEGGITADIVVWRDSTLQPLGDLRGLPDVNDVPPDVREALTRWLGRAAPSHADPAPREATDG